MEPKLIRVDKNGTKYWGDNTCPRCGGQGGRDEWYYTGKTCWECGGSGVSDRMRVWKEYTPEYAAKLEAQRAKRRAKWEAEHAEEIAAQKKAEEERLARLEAERKAKEDAERAEQERKARSEWYGAEGEKIEVKATYCGSPYYERRCFAGYGTERCYIHQFRIGNALLVWRTTCNPASLPDEGVEVTLTGTIKEHTEYKGEKQTALLRCKVK